jgi:hypothetical protein
LGRKVNHITFVTSSSIGQVKSGIRKELAKQTMKWFTDQTTSSAYQRYLKINPTLKHAPQVSKNPTIQQWVN